MLARLGLSKKGVVAVGNSSIEDIVCEREAAAGRLRLVLLAYAETLTERESDAFVLRFFGGAGRKEIAARLGVTPERADQLVEQCRVKMRRYVADK